MSTLFYNKEQKTDIPTCSKGAGTKNDIQVIDSMLLPLAVAHTEIRWAVKVVMSSASFRSCLQLNDLFRTMFSDSSIASAFQLSKTKCSYCSS